MIHYQIQIVTWNSEENISTLLDDIRAQTIKPQRIVVVDNGSTDRTLEIVNRYPEVTSIQLGQNTGFGHAHNVAFSKGRDCDYYLCLNPDVRIPQRTAEQLLTTIEKNPQIASVSPLLLRSQLTQNLLGNMIDCAGIERTLTFHFINGREGRRYHAKDFSEFSTVFANTGACVIYRRVALSSIAYKNPEIFEVFDENYFAYQEDADLGWRLQKAGMQNVVQNTAIAYHERSIQSSKPFAHRSKIIIELSHRNHLLTLLKNLTLTQSFLYGVPIILYELLKSLYLLIRFPKVFARSVLGFFNLFNQALKKRNHHIA